ncbi:hypothetical protein B0T20DRAFT_264843 [Sordaria brevicollis]|uniref:Uncharacterized protein n=1 Tax=Sordaria brevicollis TaxID=83679 RepID=A0AAE0PAE4_SORBR|nr:hypothetical protein B0T20DRAFT_264843 [Sordaria brevicollis]
MTWFGILPPFSWPWIYPRSFGMCGNLSTTLFLHVLIALFFFFCLFFHLCLLWLWITHHERTTLHFQWIGTFTVMSSHGLVWVDWLWGFLPTLAHSYHTHITFLCR